MINKWTNTTIEEINHSIKQLCQQWNVSEKDNNIIYNKIVGLQIRKVRLMRGKTQSRVAKAIGVTFQQVQKYERGHNQCSLYNLDKLSEYFEVDIDFFIKPLEDNGLTTIKRREHDYNNNRAWPQDRV